jgi:RNA polymerase sigma factor for flagellar operon FliA
LLARETSRQQNTSAASLQENVNWLGQITEKLALVYLVSETEGGEEMANVSADRRAVPVSVALAQREVGERLDQLIDALPNQARLLIRYIYFEDATLQEASSRLGMSKSWASRLHAKTLEQLARALRRLGAGD